MEDIEAKRKLRNDIEQDSMIKIRTRNLEAERQALEIERESETARLDQERDIEVRRALQRTEVARERALRETEAEQAQISARQTIEKARIANEQAIAEARILTGRLGTDQAAVVGRSDEALAKAEEQLSSGNFGAALFFASKAQDIVARVKDQAAGGDKIPSLTSYTSRTTARIRKGPALTEEILGRLPKGTAVTGEAVSGEWVKVTYGGLRGWVHSSLLQ